MQTNDFDPGFKLLEINAEKTSNILNLQAKNENGQFIFGDHGVKTPGCNEFDS